MLELCPDTRLVCYRSGLEQRWQLQRRIGRCSVNQREIWQPSGQLMDDEHTQRWLMSAANPSASVAGFLRALAMQNPA